MTPLDEAKSYCNKTGNTHFIEVMETAVPGSRRKPSAERIGEELMWSAHTVTCLPDLSASIASKHLTFHGYLMSHSRS